MMKLDHQHIRKMYNVDEIDGQLVIIMEYLEGETLSEIIHSNKNIEGKTHLMIKIVCCVFLLRYCKLTQMML